MGRSCATRRWTHKENGRRTVDCSQGLARSEGSGRVDARTTRDAPVQTVVEDAAELDDQPGSVQQAGARSAEGVPLQRVVDGPAGHQPRRRCRREPTLCSHSSRFVHMFVAFVLVYGLCVLLTVCVADGLTNSR